MLSFANVPSAPLQEGPTGLIRLGSIGMRQSKTMMQLGKQWQRQRLNGVNGQQQ